MIMKQRILLVLVVAAAVVGTIFVCQLWVTAGYYHPVAWSTAEGGLTLSYIPGKGMLPTSLIVDGGYTRGSNRTWTVVYPGATNRLFFAPPVRPPEELFAGARIPMGKSDPIGLCNLYSDVGTTQKEDIIADLRERIDNGAEVRASLRELFDGGDYPWLVSVLDD
jgi:hypothetical protein